MTDPNTIIRIAARGDGITADGRHAAGGVTGDTLLPDGSLEHGPHHVAAPCRHYAKCGACQLQHADETALAGFVQDRVVLGAEGQEIAALSVTAPHLSPPRSRRRATLHFQRAGRRIVLGFREGGSHRIVDIAECHVLHPDLFAAVAPIKTMLARWPQAKAGDVSLTLVDQGVDLGLTGAAPEGLEQTEALLDFARDLSLARLSVDHGYGPETAWEPEPATVTLGQTIVPFPVGAFLQATKDGEQALVAAARHWLGSSARISDLFAGLGTFAFALSDKAQVVAIEAARDVVLAANGPARRLARPVDYIHRDLFRNPMDAKECSTFDAILLDPPRAGAREQVGQIAESDVGRVVYISCNPASWARDAKTLVEAGFVLEELRPVGQFRWSTHVELASLFVRSGT